MEASKIISGNVIPGGIPAGIMISDIWPAQAVLRKFPRLWGGPQQTAFFPLPFLPNKNAREFA
jgi:hypothetical protein